MRAYPWPGPPSRKKVGGAAMGEHGFLGQSITFEVLSCLYQRFFCLGVQENRNVLFRVHCEHLLPNPVVNSARLASEYRCFPSFGGFQHDDLFAESISITSQRFPPPPDG